MDDSEMESTDQTEVESQEDQTTEESQDQPETEETEETTEEEEVSEEDFIEVNGEKVPIDELKAGYLRESDYRRKTQELADLKRALANPPAQTQERELSEDEKEVMQFASKYGFVRKEDLQTFMKQQQAQFTDEQEFSSFKSKNPEATGVHDAVRALGQTKPYLTMSYQEIYEKVFKPLSSPKKVVKKKVLGVAPKSGSDKRGGNKLTREAIDKMTPQEYEKNRPAIMRAMAKGEIIN